MPARLHLTGARFVRLTVIGHAPKAEARGTRWRCRCDCGTETVVKTMDLRNGDTKSCGCLQREKVGKLNVSHGRSKTPEYASWCMMINRCTNANGTDYRHYGGRGITICQRWRDSFEAFLADMGSRPSMKYSLDRINNEGNYEPGNCRWATMKEQAQTRRPRASEHRAYRPVSDGSNLGELQLKFLRELARWQGIASPKDLGPQTSRQQINARARSKRQGLVIFEDGYWKLTDIGRASMKKAA